MHTIPTPTPLVAEPDWVHQALPLHRPDQPWRDTLRGLSVFADELPAFDTDEAPEDPLALFASWLSAAIDAGVAEPHAMTLSTNDDDQPDARVLILKNLTSAGLWFATSAHSAKGRHLAANPSACLSFYWTPHGRQVRIRGQAEPAPGQESAADFRARGKSARAIALASRQSDPLTDPADYYREVGSARARLEADPSLIVPDWTLYLLRPTHLEFWQADKDRHHTRLRYTWTATAWDRQLLWP